MRLVLALLALLIPFSAHAATYHYTGQDIVCPPDSDFDCFGGDAFSGSVKIDERLYPDIAGSSLVLFMQDISGGGILTFVTQFQIGSATGSVSGRAMGIEGLTLTGIFHEWFYQTVCCEALLRIDFDSNANVSAWDGFAYWGGSNDPRISNISGDGFYDGSQSVGIGQWERVPEVPLPASGFLLAFALMTGLAARLRRS